MGVGGQSLLPKDRLFHGWRWRDATSDDTIEEGSSGNCSKMEWVLKGVFNRMVIEAWTVDPE